ncbi:MAG: glycoside hydrolase family 2 TIM barrel-domain containing protein [Armatimonadota bacterium]
MREAAAKVEIRRKRGGFELVRNGEPYYVRGACGWDYLEELKAAGGNSIRTWGGGRRELLDRAHSLGLTVCAGLWLEHTGRGVGYVAKSGGPFCYDDPTSVRAQRNRILGEVRELRNHPAVLMWGLGNEYEIVSADNPNMWRVVGELAREIKKIDSNHPVITVIADVTETKIAMIRKYCPDLDALGVNSYGGLLTLADRLRALGWEKPYLVTEFGGYGWWDTPEAPWGAPIEPDSSQTAYYYHLPYLSSIAGQRQCLGSYVYLWGYHLGFAFSDTWLQMHLRSAGEPTAAVEAMQLEWTGRLPSDRAPEIVYWQSSVALREVAPGSRHSAEVVLRHPGRPWLQDQPRLQVPYQIRWQILGEVPPAGEKWPTACPGCIISARDGGVTFRAPSREGAYRLYVYVVDDAGRAATANVPFFVKAGKRKGGTAA